MNEINVIVLLFSEHVRCIDKLKQTSKSIFIFKILNQQEAAFRKVVQATMVRDKQHGPVVELNRLQVWAAVRSPLRLFVHVHNKNSELILKKILS